MKIEAFALDYTGNDCYTPPTLVSEGTKNNEKNGNQTERTRENVAGN